MNADRGLHAGERVAALEVEGPPRRGEKHGRVARPEVVGLEAEGEEQRQERRGAELRRAEVDEGLGVVVDASLREDRVDALRRDARVDVDDAARANLDEPAREGSLSTRADASRVGGSGRRGELDGVVKRRERRDQIEAVAGLDVEAAALRLDVGRERVPRLAVVVCSPPRGNLQPLGAFCY